MACICFFVIFALVVAAVVPTITLAKDFIVGDEQGWTIGFDYQDWAKDKDFRVGDKLVFQYPAKAHNVFKVNGTGFESCIVPPKNEALITGNDEVVLATPGRKWYICGVGKHCENGGQKLFITVQSKFQDPSNKRKNSISDGCRMKAYQLSLATFMLAIVTTFLI